MKQALFIAGPTASGKSALSLKLAAEMNGVIINADSMQVYDTLRIVTACPTAADEAAAPHKLYRFLDPSETCSAVFWATRAMAEIEAAWAADQMPIVIGGTGMYFKVLLEGIAEIPDIDTDIRAEVRRTCEEAGSASLHGDLALYDPATAERLSPNDSQRVCRAVEVYRSTGKTLTGWHAETAPGLMQAADEAGLIEKMVLSPDRDIVYDRCNRRFDHMIADGALEEVEALMLRGLPDTLPAMRALGVPSLMAFLRDEVTLEEAAEESKTQTRRFAKRQLTWFRNQFAGWSRVSAQHSES
ncbi:MAG: tRNA (adenosine(37)-N6)-dimethylallyltransferase MiaA [Kordiimonadaceae bacterium]|nr:tRNA (adenosine(37)-N6)-dimethylallyltransferase MiaA [Kordiimonadaceae bacterium]